MPPLALSSSPPLYCISALRQSITQLGFGSGLSLPPWAAPVARNSAATPARNSFFISSPFACQTGEELFYWIGWRVAARLRCTTLGCPFRQSVAPRFHACPYKLSNLRI